MICRAPWIGLSLSPDTENVCCMNAYNDIRKNRIDIYNNNPCHICKNCNIKKNFDNPIYDEIYEHNIHNYNNSDGTINNMKVGWLHIIETWACNANCKICGTCEYKNKSLLPLHKIYEACNFESVKYITLQGGEIFLFKDKTLEILKSMPLTTEIQIVTNGTIYNEEILCELEKFDKPSILVSIDGNRITNEYSRPGCNYNYVIDNVNKMMLYCKKSHVTINYTVSIFNIMNILDDLIELKKNIFGEFYLNINMVVQPVMYSISNMPKYLKDKANSIINLDTIIKNNNLSQLKKLDYVLRLYGNYIFDELITLLNSEVIPCKQHKLYNETIENDKIHNLDMSVIDSDVAKYILDSKRR